jgi:hypothetical protein
MPIAPPRVGPQPSTGTDPSAGPAPSEGPSPPPRSLPDSIGSLPSDIFQRPSVKDIFQDILRNPILHPPPNPGPIPRG